MDCNLQDEVSLAEADRCLSSHRVGGSQGCASVRMDLLPVTITAIAVHSSVGTPGINGMSMIGLGMPAAMSARKLQVCHCTCQRRSAVCDSPETEQRPCHGDVLYTTFTVRVNIAGYVKYASSSLAEDDGSG